MTIHNVTFALSTYKPEITETCWNWCKEQTEIHASNLQIEALALPFLALVSFFIAFFIYNHSEWILEKSSDLTEKSLVKIFTLFFQFGMYLLIGFFIWYLYLQ